MCGIYVPAFGISGGEQCTAQLWHWSKLNYDNCIFALKPSSLSWKLSRESSGTRMGRMELEDLIKSKFMDAKAYFWEADEKIRMLKIKMYQSVMEQKNDWLKPQKNAFSGMDTLFVSRSAAAALSTARDAWRASSASAPPPLRPHPCNKQWFVVYGTPPARAHEDLKMSWK